MIGVILWSDESLNKAVIWCDDQGDLAFYTKKASEDFHELNPGDWVEFELTLSGNCRIAENLAVLLEQGSPGLADRLCAAAGRGAEAAGAGPENGTVVPFPQQSVKKRRVAAPLHVSRG
ncbi:cold shock domain-containing protein [Leisingera sp. M527]|uniref:cold shock domain-containing protein n=1 Tax=unclassified Leisingera TaxID=2614906 RepID=UPI000A9CFDC9|nr:MULTISPECIES: cold shock domain-containing protein [unclassified Leisingera]UWQ31369.1 cold shock domain-containing protein [Leisingera sp. M527]UWQ73361.1 cold shock domain-containing protein [Leisingera sp. M658]